VGTIVVFERPQHRAAPTAPQAPPPAAPGELIIFPTVNIADLRDLWLAMRSSLDERRPPK
jgi:hypothetical protein